MKQEEIINAITLQPLSLIIHSFIKSTQQAEDAQIQAKSLSFNFTIITSYFTRLNQTMNHTLIDPNIINDNNRKADKSPVPSAMWDQRIHLTFPGRRGITFLIQTCRAMLLRSYRRIFLLSFLKHLDLTCHLEYSKHKLGHRKVYNGGE